MFTDGIVVVFPQSPIVPSSSKFTSLTNVCELLFVETSQPVEIQIVGLKLVIDFKLSQEQVELQSIQ